MADVNLSISVDRLAARDDRKRANARRYRRHYLRVLQARRKAQRRMDGFISFPLFCKIVTRRISLTNTPFDINKAMLYGVET